MAVEFLTDAQAAGYGQFAGEPSQAELERFFFLGDAARDLVASISVAGLCGGLVASADGLRFVVPVRTINAAPSPRYFGLKRA